MRLVSIVAVCTLLLALTVQIQAVDLEHRQRTVSTATSFFEDDDFSSLLERSETESTNPLSTDDSNELLSVLHRIVADKKKKDAQVHSKLLHATKATQFVESQLQSKKEALQRRSAMLERIEACIKHGPPEQVLAKMKDDLTAQQTTLTHTSKELDGKLQQIHSSQKQLTEHQSTLNSLASSLTIKERALKQLEATLHARETSLTQQAELLTKREKQVAERENKLLNHINEVTHTQGVIEKKVESEINNRVAAIKKELEEKEMEKIKSMEATVANQVQQLNIEHAKSAQEQAKKIQDSFLKVQQEAAKAQAQATKAQEEIQKSKEEALQAKQEVAKAKEEALKAKEEAFKAKEEAIKFQEEVKKLQEEAANKVAPKDKDSKQKSPSTTSMSLLQSRDFMTISADATADRCLSYTKCGTCAADGACGWCGGKTNACLPHDVNANVRTILPGFGDGLTSGQCTSEDWQSSVVSRLTLLNLNVYASDRNNGTRRFSGILKLIRKTGADIIALQEVEKWFVQSLQANTWIRSNYHFSDFGPGQAPGGLYILSRYPIASINYYESIQPGQIQVSNRGRVLVAKIGVKQSPVWVATTTLDWQSAENRAASLDFIFSILGDNQHVILMGDFNFDDAAEPESSHLPGTYLDLWPTLVPDKPGFTWDPRSNLYAAQSDPLARSSRIDRILLKSNQWMPRTIHIVGCSLSDLVCATKLGMGNMIANNTRMNIFNPNPEFTGPTVIIRDTTGNQIPNINLNTDPNLVKAAVAAAGKQAFLEVDSAAQSESASSRAVLNAEAELRALQDQLTQLNAQNQPVPVPDYSHKFDPDFSLSTHYGLLVQISRFQPHC